MLPRHLSKKTWDHFSLLFLCHWLYLTLFILHYFALNGLKESETSKLNVLKPGYSMIVTHTDKRLGNIFHSTPDYFLKLYQYVPEVDAILITPPTEISFSYTAGKSVHQVARELPIILVGASYFDAFKGRFVQGRGFTRNEIFGGRPYVVMSEGALIKIFGDYDRAPSTMMINGIEFQVLGTWAFSTSDIEENESIFIPLGMVNLFGKFTSTYINNFILKGSSSQMLAKLKQGIDKIQIDAGINPTRPEFTIATTALSKRTEYIFVHNKAYVDIFIWLALVIYIFVSVRSNNQWLNFGQDWVSWKFMAGHKQESFAREASESWVFTLTVSLGASVILGIILLGFLRMTLSYNFAIGSLVHYSFFIYVAFLPIQFVLLHRIEKKLRYNIDPKAQA